MRNVLIPLYFSIFVFVAPLTAVAGGGHDHGHGDHASHEEPIKGSHGGRLLSKDDFSLEITIFEKDVPPVYRIFPYMDGDPLDPAKVKVSVVLTRFGGKKDTYALVPRENYLTSDKEVGEPHSFVVEVSAEHGEESYTWQYDSFEGRTEFSHEALAAAGLEFDIAGPRDISRDTHVYGRLLANEDRVAHIRPRFSGVVKQIRKSLGQPVQKGETLAVVESNQGLQPYEIRSEIDGIIILRHATLGEFVSEGDEIFVVADLSELWADFQIYRDDFGEITPGRQISIELERNKEPLQARVSYVSPITDEVTQSKLIRAVLPNQDGKLRPGLFVSGILSASHKSVPLAVRRDAIQTFRDWNVVYLTDGHVFQAMPVELGSKDSKYIEILEGINAGDKYVSKGSFLVKADVEKSGASHDH